MVVPSRSAEIPQSPMGHLAQPWAVLGGNTLSALVGLVFAYWVPEPQWACGLAVGAAMVVMFGARCLHPPGGAIALLTALHHTTNPLMAILPILLNSIVLVAVAVVYNSRTGRPYPHVTAALPRENIEHGPRFSKSDLDAALVRYNEVIDIDRDDLESLFYEAEALAWERTLGELRCHQVMSKDVITVHQKDNLAQAREQLYKHAVKALPVIDVTRRVVGIVTMADLFTRTAGYGNTRSNTTGDDPHGGGRVEDVMTRQVRVASDTNRVMDLLPLFSEGGHHHLPVINADKQLVGMITQSDVIRVLHRNLG